uniref:Uncharacterized protein n=1 Tax=Solanum lycopersicum TaxID=4081 RepID=A0A3Q7J0E7_SOLLC
MTRGRTNHDVAHVPAETFKEMHSRTEAVARSPAASLFTAYSWKGEAHDAKEIVLMIDNWSEVLLFSRDVRTLIKASCMFSKG